MNLCILCLGGQTCTDSVNIHQNGHDLINSNRLVIIPRLNFTCSGRIIEIMARMRMRIGTSFPYIQIWRQIKNDPIIFSNIGEVQIQESQVLHCRNDTEYCTVNIVLTGNNRIEFQSGDVVGYYHPSDIQYRVRTLRTSGYIQFEYEGSTAPTTVILDNADRSTDHRQPLIQFVIGKMACYKSVLKFNCTFSWSFLCYFYYSYTAQHVYVVDMHSCMPSLVHRLTPKKIYKIISCAMMCTKHVLYHWISNRSKVSKPNNIIQWSDNIM